MAFASVVWGFKDVVTSTKLAQMVENDRTHDHITADQGAKLGVLGSTTGGADQGITGTGIVAVTTSALTITIPTGTPGGRHLVVFATVSARTTLPATIQLWETWTTTDNLNGSSEVRRPAQGLYTHHSLMAWIPVSTIGTGSKTITTRAQFSVGDPVHAVNFSSKIALLI